MAAVTEIAGLTLVTALVALFSGRLPRRVDLGDVMLLGAAFLLVQGRAPSRRRALDAGAVGRRSRGAPARTSRACAESTLGISAIVAGSVLLFAWTPIRLPASRIAWTSSASRRARRVRVLHEGARA